MTKQTLRGPQGDLVVESSGDGNRTPSRTPVIFIHSDMGTRDQWHAAMNHIADEHRAIAFDRRGHGESEVPRNGDYSIERSTEDVLAVADALRINRFVLVGHSGGGAIAFVCAAQHPERVAGLLLVDPEPDPAAFPPSVLKSQLAAMRGSDYEKTILEYYGSLAGPQQDVKERIVASACVTPKETGVGTLRAFIEFRPRSYAGRYHGPALAIIQSQFDTPDALHQIGGFEHESIDGVGHWLQLGAATKFNAVLDRFLDQVENAPHAAQPLNIGESAASHATPISSR